MPQRATPFPLLPGGDGFALAHVISPSLPGCILRLRPPSECSPPSCPPADRAPASFSPRDGSVRLAFLSDRRLADHVLAKSSAWERVPPSSPQVQSRLRLPAWRRTDAVFRSPFECIRPPPPRF